ncbi:MAG: tetratricopeptide repeat protein [Coraliomargaritaceae bacterium]
MRVLLIHFAGVLALILVSLLARPLEGPAWEAITSEDAAMKLESVEASLGQGFVVGVLGGFRTIIADLLWLRLNTFWEERDTAKVAALVGMVTTLDPKPDFFWIQSARILAYDMPNWRIRDEGGYEAVPETRWDAIDSEQAERAFILLERARHYHPENPKIPLEIGQIYLNRLDSPVEAAPWFLAASKLPDAPFYAARIYGELLRQTGRLQDAYLFLRKLYEDLPDDNPFAQKPVVLERIRELESELGLPSDRRFRIE